MFFLQAKALRRSERQVDCEQNLQNKSVHIFTDVERYQQQPNEANYVHLNAGIRLKPSAFHQSTHQAFHRSKKI